MAVKLELLRGLSRCVWVHVFAYLTVFLRVLLFAGSWDNTVRLWEVATQRELAVLTGHTSIVTSVRLTGAESTWRQVGREARRAAALPC